MQPPDALGLWSCLSRTGHGYVSRSHIIDKRLARECCVQSDGGGGGGGGVEGEGMGGGGGGSDHYQ